MVFYVFFSCFFPFLYTAPFFANMAKRAANILERSLPRPPKTVDFLGTLHRYVDQQQGPAVADPIHGTLLAQANRKPAGSENVERTGLKICSILSSFVKRWEPRTRNWTIFSVLGPVGSLILCCCLTTLLSSNRRRINGVPRVPMNSTWRERAPAHSALMRMP